MSRVFAQTLLVSALAAVCLFGVDAKEHSTVKVELWHGGATRVSDPDPVLLRYNIAGGSKGLETRIACNGVELMKTPAQDSFDFHFKGTPVKHHRAHVALINDGKLVSTSHTDFEYFKPGVNSPSREGGLTLKLLTGAKVATGGRTELQYSLADAPKAGQKVKIAVSGMQLLDLDAEASYKFHFDNIPRGSYVTYAALLDVDGKLLYTDSVSFDVVEGGL